MKNLCLVSLSFLFISCSGSLVKQPSYQYGKFAGICTYYQASFNKVPDKVANLYCDCMTEELKAAGVAPEVLMDHRSRFPLTDEEKNAIAQSCVERAEKSLN